MTRWGAWLGGGGGEDGVLTPGALGAGGGSRQRAAEDEAARRDHEAAAALERHVRAHQGAGRSVESASDRSREFGAGAGGWRDPGGQPSSGRSSPSD
jgi:hypothetical protein